MKYFDFEYRVRYGDTDKMGITYYANYLVWFEVARTEYFRALGLPYTDCEKQGLYLPVIESHINYHATSTYDDLVVIRTSVSEFATAKMKFEYQIFAKAVPDKIITTGYTVHVFVDKAMRPARAPKAVKDSVMTYSLLHRTGR